MLFIGIGCLAFIFFILFDFNKTLLIHKWLRFTFFIGIALLAYSTLAICLDSFKTTTSQNSMQWLFGLIALVSLVLLNYTLFLGIPFSNTYIQSNQKNTVIDTGMYALCRHPGVLWFFFFYLFLWLTFGSFLLMWAMIIWTVINLIYVYIQDRWLFPKMFVDYEQYRDNVPFLIPTLDSFKKCLRSL